MLPALAFCVCFEIPRTDYYCISDTGSAPSVGDTQKEIAVFRGPFFEATNKIVLFPNRLLTAGISSSMT